MNQKSNGEGSILSDAGQNNPKRKSAKRMPLQERIGEARQSSAGARQQAAMIPVPLGDCATASLATLCRRYRVKPERVMQSIVESYLIDACTDDTLAPVVANEAREIERTGTVPSDWWLKDAAISTPGFENEVPDESGSGPAPTQELSLKDGAAGAGRATKENAEITLRLTPAAHGLLVAMAAYREDADVETSIVAQLAENVEAWCEGTSNQGAVQELFLSGEVVVKKEAR